MMLKIAAVLFLSAVCPLWGSAVLLEFKILFCCRLCIKTRRRLSSLSLIAYSYLFLFSHCTVIMQMTCLPYKPPHLYSSVFVPF